MVLGLGAFRGLHTKISLNTVYKTFFERNYESVEQDESQQLVIARITMVIMVVYIYVKHLDNLI